MPSALPSLSLSSLFKYQKLSSPFPFLFWPLLYCTICHFLIRALTQLSITSHDIHLSWDFILRIYPVSITLLTRKIYLNDKVKIHVTCLLLSSAGAHLLFQIWCRTCAHPSLWPVILVFINYSFDCFMLDPNLDILMVIQLFPYVTNSLPATACSQRVRRLPTFSILREFENLQTNVFM